MCCRDFTDQKRVENAEEIEIPCAKRLRSDYLPFDWKKHCILCGKLAIIDTRLPNQSQIKSVNNTPLM